MEINFCNIFMCVLLTRWAFVQGCGKDEKPIYCRHKVIPQRMCTSLDPVPCTQWSIRCACLNNKLRRADGKCVDAVDCTKTSESTTMASADKEPGKRKPKDPHRVYENTKQLLQNHGKILLVQISTSVWMRSDCDCMESSFRQDYTPENPNEEQYYVARRTVDCHARLNLPTGMNAMIKEEMNAKIGVIEDTGVTKISVRPTRKDGKDIPTAEEKNLTVITATPACVVLKIAEVSNGQPQCAFWGLEVVGDSTDEKPCFDAMKKDCMQPLTWAFHHRERCDLHNKWVKEYETMSKTKLTS